VDQRSSRNLEIVTALITGDLSGLVSFGLMHVMTLSRSDARFDAIELFWLMPALPRPTLYPPIIQGIGQGSVEETQWHYN
jgi:hypothetical protein